MTRNSLTNPGLELNDFNLGAQPLHISPRELRDLDALIGKAMTDDQVCQRLVIDRDQELFQDHNITRDVQTWLQTVPATTLQELASYILAASL